MKKLASLIVVLIAVGMVNAQTATLLQHSGASSAFYGNQGFQNAYNAAVNGDTIYLPGGFYPPPSLFDKRISVIGAGHHPDSSAATLTTVINGDITLGDNADGSSFTGFYLNGGFGIGYNTSVINLTISRVYMTTGISISGDRSTPCINGNVRECIITGEVYGTNISQFTFANNIFLHRIIYLEASMLTNNIFLGGDDMGGIYRVLYYINQSVIRNNIFYKPINDFPTSSSNQFQNNIFTNTPPLTGNTATGNFFNVSASDIFVSYDNTGFKYTHNFHLKTPASYAGTDATQVGLYGTAKPWKEGSVPMNPHLQTKTIAENTDADGKIQVQIKVAAQNN